MGVDVRVRVKGGGHVSQIYGKLFNPLSVSLSSHVTFMLVEHVSL